MGKRYQVRDWNLNFENNKSRERDHCQFVCVPNKQHGMGLTRILSQPDGMTIYGAWQLIIGACSQQRRPRDGHLTDTGRADGCPWGAEELALRFRSNAELFTRALSFLSSEAIGWIEVIDSVPIECPSGARVVPDQCLGMEGNGREEKEENRRAISVEPEGPNSDTLTESRREAYDAFDRWSQVGRGHGLQNLNGEHKSIAALVDKLSGEPAIARDNTLVKRHLLIGIAVDGLIRGQKEFKNPKYAAATVENLLAEWSRKGIPGNKTAKKPDKILTGPVEYGGGR